jgi:predicted transcriptional regulator
MELEKQGYTIYIEVELKKKLKKEAKRKRRSPSSIVNEMLEERYGR